MTTFMRNDKSAVDLFLSSLDSYEQNLPTNNSEPTAYASSAVYMQMALNRLITANIPDTYQMMRQLSLRMIAGKNSTYSSYTVLMLTAGSSSSLFKDEVAAIVQTLQTVMNGGTVSLDLMWQSRVNSNNAIKAFIQTYPTSDIALISNTSPSSVIAASTNNVIPLFSLNQEVDLTLGVNDRKITLTGTSKQMVKFVLDSNFVYPQSYNPGSKSVITTSVTIVPKIQSFYLHRSVRFTDTALAMMQCLDCLKLGYVVGNDTWFKVPAQFFSVKFDVMSVNGGTNWIVTNVQIVPPSLK